MSDSYLITGGAGFIGSTIAHHLVAAGASVRILDNFSTGRSENLEGIRDHVDVVRGDLRDAETVGEACRGVRFVLHQGALPSVSRSVQDPVATNDVNIGGTLNLLVKAREAGVERVVFASSSSVYGDTIELPKRESMTPNPLSPYALSKLTTEHYGRLFHQLYGLQTFALRYFNVFGPRQDPASQYAAVIPLFIDALHHDRAPVIYGDGEQTRDFTYVDDVVEANLCCCRAPAEAAGTVYNVAWGNRTSILDLVQALNKLMGKEIPPTFEDRRAGDVRDSQADASRAEEALGWRPTVTLSDGLTRTMRWFTGEGT